MIVTILLSHLGKVKVTPSLKELAAELLEVSVEFLFVLFRDLLSRGLSRRLSSRLRSDRLRVVVLRRRLSVGYAEH